MGIETINPEVTISSKKFEEKYGISGRELNIQYGQEPTTMKTVLQHSMKKGELSEADISVVTQVEQEHKKVQTKTE